MIKLLNILIKIIHFKIILQYYIYLIENQIEY